MKPFTKIAYIILIAAFNFSCATTRQQEPAYTEDGSVDFQLFYDQLSPYGQWVDYPNYGYVWVPDVRREFAPYSTNGHWVMTDYGWTWISDYRWGWAPFHYGRWDYDNYHGWFWVPDDQWGPAWVSWRAGNGYYGWAPLRPGMGIRDSFNDRYVNRWNFVRESDFGRRDIHRYYINRGNYGSIIDQSTVIDNTYQDRRRNATYIAGPTAENVQRATGRAIDRVRVRDHERPGQKLNNDELSIYRPRVQRTAGKTPVPSKVADRQEIKPVGERGTGNQRNRVAPTDNTRDQQMQPRQTGERRRLERQQQMEKSQPIQQTQPGQSQTDRLQENERRNMERQRPLERQNRQMQQAGISQVEQQQENERRKMERQRPSERQSQAGQQQQPAIPVSPQEERREIQQEQIEKQDRTKQEQLVKQQQQQVERQQQKIERQQQQVERQQQIERRRQERQSVRQQQTERSQQTPQVQPAQSQEQKEEQRKINPPSENRRR